MDSHHGQQKWHTLSEDTIRKTAAAWRWLHVGMNAANTELSTGLFSMLLLSGLKVQERGVDRSFVSLGHATWAALAWPLQLMRDDGGLCVWAFDLRPEDAGVKWLHVTDPLSWNAFP